MSSTKTKKKISRASSKTSHKKSNPDMKIPDAWINELETLHVNEPSWSCLVALLVERSSNTTVYMDHFNEAATVGNRIGVNAISTLVVVRAVMKNISEGRMTTPKALLCNEIYKAVGPGFEDQIPTELLAPLIKYIILEYKELNMKVNEGIKTAEKRLEEYHQMMLNVSKAKSPPGKGKSEEGSKKSVKHAKTKVKAFTKLRRRGEQWKEKQWIDDSPLGGPNLYVLISTFYDADLILELVKYNIPLNAVVKLDLEKTPVDLEKSSNINLHQESMIEQLLEFKRRSSPFLSSIIKKRISVLQDNLDRSMSSFWGKLENLKTNINSALLFKDLMFPTFVPQYHNFQFEIKEFQEEIYKQLTYFLYDILEMIKLHKHYLERMKVIDVSDTNVTLLSEMEVYNSILDSIPHEVVTIPLILDTLLAQVCILDTSKILKQNEKECLTSKETENIIHVPLLKHISHLNFKYDLHFDNDSTRNSSIFSTKKNLFKTILQYSDNIRLKTFHLDIKLIDLVVNRSNFMLKSAWKNVLEYKGDKIINSFNTLYDDIFQIYKESRPNCDSLYYYLYLLIINNVVNSLLLFNHKKESSNQDNCSKMNDEDVCEGCTRKFYLGVDKEYCFSYIPSDTSSSVQKDEESVVYVEYLGTDVLLQNIQSAHLNYNKLEKTYCPLTDEVLLIFHNIPDYFEESWIGKLTTPVPLRDFIEYVLDEEGELLDAMILDDVELLSEYSSSNSRSQVGNHMQKNINLFSIQDTQFISHRSLKYEAMKKQNHIIQNISQKTSLQGSENTNNTSSIKIKTKDHKIKSVAVIKEDVSEVDCFQKVENHTFKFLGYNLGEPMRFQFNGVRKCKSLDKNCKVILDTCKKLYGAECIRLQIQICHHILFYTIYNESDSIIPFHLILSSGVVLYFGLPQLHECREIRQTLSQSKTSDTDTSTKDAQEVLSHQSENIFHILNNFNLNHNLKDFRYFNIPLLYQLKMSTPSGLHVEMKESHEMLYVKQTRLSTKVSCSTHGEEEFRCLLSSGYIVKFFVNGKVVVLGANGEIYTIHTKRGYFDSRSEDVIEHVFSEVLLDDKKTAFHSDTKSDVPTKMDKDKQSYIIPMDSLQDNTVVNNLNPPKHSKNHSLSQPTESSTNSYDYDYISADGKHYRVIEGKNIERHEDLSITSHINIQDNCITTERSDSTTTKHLEDGSLIVKFQDGSHMISVPILSEEVFCEWSKEELLKWFIMSTKSTSQDEISGKQRSDTGQSVSAEESHSNSKSLFEASDEGQNENALGKKEKVNSLFSDSTSNEGSYNKLHYAQDGFTVYNISYRLEHSSYGSVNFDAEKFQIDIELPKSTKITLRNNGTYEAFFPQAGLIVDESNIYFNKHSDDRSLERITVVSNSKIKNNKENNDYVVDEEALSQKISVNSFGEVESKKVLLEDFIKKNHDICALFYSIDCFGDETYIDYNFCFHTHSRNSELHKIINDDITCFVIDKNLNGFRIMRNNEVDEYVSYVDREHGLVIKDENTFTSVSVKRNELEKWLMVSSTERDRRYNKKSNKDVQISTYGGRDLWFQPFKVMTELNLPEFHLSDVMVIRLLEKIHIADVAILCSQWALDMLNKNEKSEFLLGVVLARPKSCSTLNDVILNHDLLEQIYKEEEIKIVSEYGEVKRKLKDIQTCSQIRQACMKSRKSRLKVQNEKLKTTIRTNILPPFYMSWFGSIHTDLDQNIEVDFDKIVSTHNIDLNIVNMILEKPLSLISSQEVDLMCKIVEESQCRKCPILVSEELIFRDLLEARQQLSHYFSNLKVLLEYCQNCTRIQFCK